MWLCDVVGSGGFPFFTTIVSSFIWYYVTNSQFISFLLFGIFLSSVIVNNCIVFVCNVCDMDLESAIKFEIEIEIEIEIQITSKNERKLKMYRCKLNILI